MVPHPRLQDEDGVLIPDFLAQRVDDLWEVVELKRKDVSILKHGRRRTFYADFEQYYEQCRSYSRFFQQNNLRSAFNTQTGLGVQSDIGAVVVAGRRGHVDLPEVHRLLTERGGRVTLQTYDDVHAKVSHLRRNLYGAIEQLDGVFVSLFFVPEKLNGEDNCILDFGVVREQSRWSSLPDRPTHESSQRQSLWSKQWCCTGCPRTSARTRLRF